jgi:hypothetical protein
MHQPAGTHPSLDQLAAFDRGQLRPAEWEAVGQHLASCDACCGQLEAVPDDPFVARVRESAGTPAPVRALDTVNLRGNSTSAAGGAAPAQPPAPPAELANHPRYRVLEALGAGGMGVVFKVEHRLMERVVALKVISRSLTDRPELVARFRQEVKAAARLSHPNIVTAHDADQAGDVHFLVMEFVEGESLDRLVEEQGPLPVEQACDYVRQAALGLQHAFERGMVHRDIKPHNLMLTSEGQVKILDFGLARFASESRPAGGLTEAGQVVGTPDYMAPEQALDARRADVRADVYSLGCTLYHLLTGRLPFPEGTAFQKLLAHQQQTPTPVRDFRGDVPPDLLRVLDRMLAKDPAQRYQTPGEVARALAAFAVAEAMPVVAEEVGSLPALRPVPAAGRGRGRRRAWLLVAAAGAFLAAAVLAGIIIIITTKNGRLTFRYDTSPEPMAAHQGDTAKTPPGQGDRQPAAAEDLAGVERPGQQPPAGAVPAIPPPRLVNARTEVMLPEPFAQVRTGGAGRYLIFYLKKARQLAVFDVTQVRVVHHIDLPADEVLYAAGLDKLMVVLPGQKLIQRWDLRTFQRETIAEVPDDRPVRLVLMGCNSRGPLLLWGGGDVLLWDVDRMQPLAVSGKVLSGDPQWWFTARVSADGRAFVGWHGGISGQRYALMRLDGRRSTILASPDDHTFNGHWAQPTADAGLVLRFESGAVYSDDMKVISAEWFRGAVLLPTEDPRFFLAVREGKDRKDDVSVCTSADRQPVYTVTGVEKMTSSSLNSNWGYVGGEPRAHYLPTANVLLTLPESNDRVVVRPLDLMEALDRSSEDYLFVASVPRTRVATGSTYVYRLDARSKAGGVTYKLESGPKGMTVSPAGELRWDVPARQDGKVPRVVVSVRSASGKEALHSFEITVEPQREQP